MGEPSVFDRDRSLEELLLSGGARAELEEALGGLLGQGFYVRDAAGRTLLGDAGHLAGEATEALALRYGVETVGEFAAAGATANERAAVAQLLQLVMRLNARYLMVSELHAAAIDADFAALKEKHAALEQSEARYRALTESLEQRVAEQVRTIEAARTQLYQVEKMAAVGQLAAGMAHEINNPIGFVKSNLTTARGYVASLRALAPFVRARDAGALEAAWSRADLDFVLEDFDALLRESAAGAERVARIVSDLKAFSSVDQTARENLDLNACIRAVCNVARPQVAERADIEFDLGPLSEVYGNAARLNEVFLNIILNAAQAMERRGRILIETRGHDGQAVMRVTDDGRGIPAALLARVFDPFFTTREVGQGTGLGLTVARDIVRAHGGDIAIESTPGVGTTVTVRLPVAAAAR